MWIVVWTTLDGGGCMSDHYGAFESLSEAKEAYLDLLDEGVYSAHLCAPVDSTDYGNPLR